MENRLRSYCNCHSKEDLKNNPNLKNVFTKYRVVKTTPEETCVDCGHYVMWYKNAPTYNIPSRDYYQDYQHKNDRQYNWELFDQFRFNITKDNGGNSELDFTKV